MRLDRMGRQTGLSETIAAAVYLLSENRRAEEVVGNLIGAS
jgi:hypothetical protein